MFRKPPETSMQDTQPVERVTSVLGPGINWTGSLRGSGGIRIEGNFEGDIQIKGLLVVGETGKVTCQTLRANTTIVAGLINGNVIAEKLEIRSTGRVWGDVHVVAFSTEEGAFLRGQVTMEEQIDLGIENPIDVTQPTASFKETPAAVDTSSPTVIPRKSKPSRKS